MASQGSLEMSTYDSILVAVDGSNPADAAGLLAVRMAIAFDASVTAVSAVEEHSLPEPFETDAEDVTPEESAAESLERLAASADDADVPCRTMVERGAASDVVSAAADRVDADLVAMGTHGRTGVDRVLLGSVAERTLRTSDVPVVTTQAFDAADPSVDSVLIPTDGSDCAERAVEHGLAVAERFDATVHAVSVVDVQSMAAAYGGGAAIASVVDELRETHERAADAVVERADERGVDAVKAVSEGPPARTIDEYVEDGGIDFVTVGTHGRSGLERYLLGSVAESVIRTSVAPVMAVPP